MMSVELVALLVFLSCVFGIACFIVAVQQRLEARSTNSTSVVLPRRLRRTSRLAGISARGDRRGPISRFDRWIADLMWDSNVGWEPAAVALLAILCGLVCAGAIFVWQEDIIATLLGLLGGMACPLLYLVYLKRKRIKQLQDQLPNALDMLARSVRAGKSLDQSLGIVGEQAPEPIGGVFQICAKQLELGMSMQAVMQSLIERVRLNDMRVFTTTITVHRQTGGNVAQVLERLANVVRDRLSYRRQLRVSTGASKASALLVALIGPLVFAFFVIFRPDYVSTMLESQLGLMVLLFAAFLELVGLIWTARLLKPTY